MNAYKCDRCKRFVEDVWCPGSDVFAAFYGSDNTLIEHTLCPDCTKLLKQWIENASPDPSK